MHRSENMDEEQRDDCLIEIKIKVAKMGTDIHWIKRMGSLLIIALAALLGVSLPPGLPQ